MTRWRSLIIRLAPNIIRSILYQAERNVTRFVSMDILKTMECDLSCSGRYIIYIMHGAHVSCICYNHKTTGTQ